MPEGIIGAEGAFWLGLASASGALGGGLLGLMTPFRHQIIAAIVAFGAGVLLSAASMSSRIVAEALIVGGTVIGAGAIIAGAATFSIANAALAAARDRKRCGECREQLSEAEAPGSGVSIVLGTALDAVPKALVLGVTSRVSGPDVTIVVLALALSNVSEALSATAGMRQAARSSAFVLSLWSGVVLGTAATTALTFHLVGYLGPGLVVALRTFGAGALVAMVTETIIPEAFHHGPRYSGVLAALGLASLILLGEVIN